MAVRHIVASSAETKRGQPRVNPVSTWGQPGVKLRTTWPQPGVNLASSWGQPGSKLQRPTRFLASAFLRQISSMPVKWLIFCVLFSFMMRSMLTLVSVQYSARPPGSNYGCITGVLGA